MKINKKQHITKQGQVKRNPTHRMGTVHDIEGYDDLSSNWQDIVRDIRRNRPTIYTNLKRVSQSGMMRVIDVFYIKNNKKQSLNFLMTELLDYKRDNDTWAIKVGGVGMDMGFSVVYNFSRHIFPKGFVIRKGDSNRNAFNGAKPSDPNYNYDTDGGYALKQQWW